MNMRESRFPIRGVGRTAARIVCLLTLLLVLSNCVWIPFGDQSAVDLAPFKAMARNGMCNDTRNNLYVIDDQLVFHDIAGSCADASYSQMLYDGTPDQVLCTSHDSIAGPMKNCEDPQYQAMFDTILDHLDQPDLGLGPQHSVQPVNF